VRKTKKRAAATMAVPRRARVKKDTSKAAGAVKSPSDSELIQIAREAVPKPVRGQARVIRGTRTIARAGKKKEPSIAEQVAKLVGAELPAEEEEATVEFEDQTPLGKRNTAVHLRQGIVTRVVTRAKR
jgi:hypothetical protein